MLPATALVLEGARDSSSVRSKVKCYGLVGLLVKQLNLYTVSMLVSLEKKRNYTDTYQVKAKMKEETLQTYILWNYNGIYRSPT